MRLRLGLLGLLACLDTVACAEEVDTMPDDADGPALQASLLAVNGAKVAETAATLLYTKFDDSSSKLFEHYNRFKDASKQTGEQALGTQEVRQILKDIGLANFALRGQLAAAAISVCDSDGDGKVSERELGAVIGLARCWLGSSDSTRAAVERIAALGARVGDDWHATPLLLQELRSCAGLRPFVSRWSGRLHNVASAAVHKVAALHQPENECVASLLPQLRGGHTALRKLLKGHGVEPLLARVLLASGVLLYADGDGYGKACAPSQLTA